MKQKYETLQSIVDQLEFCEYQTKDGLHDLKMNTAFIELKQRAISECTERKFIQISTSVTDNCTFIVGLCDDGTVWTSDNFKSWEFLDKAPQDKKPDSTKEVKD